MSQGETIRLANPVSHQFGAFIFANSLKCDHVLEQDSAFGQHIVICGAGPSLAEHADEWCHRGDQVWGCNSAMPYLIDRGYKCTHGLTIDQTPHMVEEWYDAYDVEYLVASSVHPNLVEWLLSKGRTLRFFHNFVGLEGQLVMFGQCEGCGYRFEDTEGVCDQCGGELKQSGMTYEEWVYCSIYPSTVRVGSGLNSVSRAVEAAMYVGAAKVTVLGADCALRTDVRRPPLFGSPEQVKWLNEDVVMHADGSGPLRSGATAQTLEAEIDGRYWVTKPDMAITARFLVEMKRHYGHRLQLIGDTLPNALMDKPDEFLNQLPNIIDHNGNPVGFIPPPPGTLTEIGGIMSKESASP